MIIDLTELGAQTTADQWYKGFLAASRSSSALQRRASAWWDAHAEHAYAHRLIRYLREVALVERPERLVLFVDEIDTTLRLDFTDDFFAAIRFLYQNRAAGSGAAADLVRPHRRRHAQRSDQGRVAHAVQYRPPHRAHRLLPRGSVGAGQHLPLPPDGPRDLIDWILRWTGGHPYLTMRVLRSLAESPPEAWTADAVDGRLHELFLGPAGESDTNLQFVRDMLTRKAFDREAVLATYDAIRGGARVPDKEQDQIASWLKLSGDRPAPGRPAAGPQPDLRTGVRSALGPRAPPAERQLAAAAHAYGRGVARRDGARHDSAGRLRISPEGGR